MTNPLVDMEKAHVLFTIGTNMTECHPVAAAHLKRALARGAVLVNADPRRTRLAELAHLHLPLRVGSDAALLLAMAHVLARDGLVDEDFIAEHTTGYEEFREHVSRFPPEWASPICGVLSADIEMAARLYGGADRAAIYYTLGITEHVGGVDNVLCLSNLALMTGNLGREGTGINPLRGQNNVQGAGDAGAAPNCYPGFQPVSDPAARRRFEAAYGREIDEAKGPTKIAAMERCGDTVRAMLIDGENTVLSDADGTRCRRALERLDHLVVADIFLTETARLAHVVLPAAAWAESDGTFTNTERRVQRVRAAVSAPGQARPDWWIVCQLARRLGFPGFDFEHPREIFGELCSLSPIYRGLSWERAATGSFHWPVPDAQHPGTPRLHEGGFSIGRGVFKPVHYRDPAESLSPEYPIWLTTGRRLATYHTGTQTRRAAGFDYLDPGERLEVHPQDAARSGLVDGGWCRMTSPRGAVDVRVECTERSPRGTVFASFSFAETPINVLTGGGYDPHTDTPEFKVCPVRLEPAQPDQHKACLQELIYRTDTVSDRG
ncbi:MAG: molybdopterin-dependent oxidoreductase [Armatimonadetes bacterium]|nr:molybdopterin-dependent oxidoreductase [Armatimonadota bacterium]